MPELAEGDSFHVIVGSAASALIGLQFVVMTLIAERPHYVRRIGRCRIGNAGDLSFRHRVAFVSPSALHGMQSHSWPLCEASLASAEQSTPSS